jgi:hypothetical protein
MEIPHFVMERKMLLGIRARAERAYAESATGAAAASPSVGTRKP